MAHVDPYLNEQLSEWSGLLGDYLESLLEYGEREVELSPGLLHALSVLPTLPGVSPAAARTAEDVKGEQTKTGPGRSLDAIAGEIAQCTRCELHRTRTRTVPGQGNPHPEIVFIGEGPGAEEDRQGLAFVGPAGQLLTRLIEAMGLKRDDVFIANIVKCRPTEGGQGKRDRAPSTEEMAVCLPYLREQITALRPRVLILLGNVALDGLFGFRGITRHRGRWLDYEGVPTMPTYHPSYLLRGGGEDRARYWDVWDDMCAVLDRLGRKPRSQKKRPAQYGGTGP